VKCECCGHSKMAVLEPRRQWLCSKCGALWTSEAAQ